MLKNLSLLPAAFAMMLLPSAALAESDLLAFRVSEVTAIQPGGDSFSGEVSWNPGFRIWGPVSFRANAGASDFKNKLGADILILEIQGLAAVRLGSFSLEAGAGSQIWEDTGSDYLALSGNALYRFDPTPWGFIYDVFVGYTSVQVPSFSTQEIKVGLQVLF